MGQFAKEWTMLNIASPRTGESLGRRVRDRADAEGVHVRHTAQRASPVGGGRVLSSTGEEDGMDPLLLVDLRSWRSSSVVPCRGHVLCILVGRLLAES